jgi:mono/diheme cytochrome c family protein
MSRISKCGQFLGLACEMKKIALFAAATIWLFDLSSCETTSFAPPPVTAELAQTGVRQHVDIATLREGRGLFVHRCIECHTLPPFWHYRTEDWPDIVNSMSHRANLKPAERDAIVAYILAVRGQ